MSYFFQGKGRRVLLVLIFAGAAIVVAAAMRSPGAVSNAQTALSAYDQFVLAGNPVAFWDMNAKSRTETDLTGHGHTGTYKGGMPSAATMPNGEPAADFNGSSQYLTVPSSNVFSIPTTNVLTWEAWIRPDTLQFPHASSDGYVDFMGKCANYSPSCEWEGRMYNAVNPQGRTSRISAYAFNPWAGLGSAADWQPAPGSFAAGSWIYVVAEYTLKYQPSNCANTGTYPGSINIWVNGVLWDQMEHAPTGCMSQYNVKPNAGASPLNIGTMALDTWFKGAIGKVAIYHYALNQSQITSHYKLMTGLLPTGSCSTVCSL